MVDKKSRKLLEVTKEVLRYRDTECRSCVIKIMAAHTAALCESNFMVVHLWALTGKEMHEDLRFLNYGAGYGQMLKRPALLLNHEHFSVSDKYHGA